MSTLQATNFKHNASASNNITLDASGNTALNGNVGVGTTSLAARLTVNSGVTDEIARFDGSTVVNPYISLFRQGTRMGYWYAPGGNYVELTAEGRPLFLTTTGSNPTLFLTNSAERMRIDASGNVGIGTSSPAERLHVVGDLRLQQAIPELKFVSEGNVNRWYIGANISDAVNGGLMFGTGAGIGSGELMRIDPGGNFNFNSGYGSVATAYGCRAWVNFNGTGTVAIRASGNVSSITDNGVGVYAVNFTTSMPDTNYSVSGSCSTNGVSNGFLLSSGNTGRNTGNVTVIALTGPGALMDPEAFSVAIFR